MKVKYSSSNPKIARVDSKGKITAVKKGTAVITAKANTKKFNCKVTVKAAQKPEADTYTGAETIFKCHHLKYE